MKEPDPRNQAALAETLGKLGDAASLPILAALLADAGRPEAVRAAALRGLSTARDRRSLRARLGLIYDPNAPPSLVAAALPDLARAGFLPPNDLASFLENPAAPVRAAALLSLNVKKPLPADLKQSVLDRLDDPAREVREAAILAVVAFRMPEAVPRLLALAGKPEPPDRTPAIAALCRLPDPRAVSIYLAAIRDRDPQLRRAGESALLAIRDRVPRSARRGGAVGRVLRSGGDVARARAGPVRADPRLAGDRAVPQDHAPGLRRRALDRLRPGPRRGRRAGRSSWTPRQADPTTGRVDLDDLKRRGRRPRRLRLRRRRLARPLRLRLRRGRVRPRGPRADAPGLERAP